MPVHANIQDSLGLVLSLNHLHLSSSLPVPIMSPAEIRSKGDTGTARTVFGCCSFLLQAQLQSPLHLFHFISSRGAHILQPT